MPTDTDTTLRDARKTLDDALTAAYVARLFVWNFAPESSVGDRVPPCSGGSKIEDRRSAITNAITRANAAIEALGSAAHLDAIAAHRRAVDAVRAAEKAVQTARRATR